MRSIFFMLFLFVSFYNSNAQEYNKSTVAIDDIKRGITDLEFFRAVLLEKGMSFEKRDDYGEYWRVSIDKGSEGEKRILSQLAVQISTFNIGQSLRERVIIFKIRKDLLPKYNELFATNISNSFPEKKAEKSMVYKNGSDVATEDYELYYYRKDSNIRVYVEERDSWVHYKFKILVK